MLQIFKGKTGKIVGCECGQKSFRMGDGWGLKPQERQCGKCFKIYSEEEYSKIKCQF